MQGAPCSAWHMVSAQERPAAIIPTTGTGEDETPSMGNTSVTWCQMQRRMSETSPVQTAPQPPPLRAHPVCSRMPLLQCALISRLTTARGVISHWSSAHRGAQHGVEGMERGKETWKEGGRK